MGNKLIAFENKSSEELAIIMSQIQTAQINKLNAALKQMQNDNKKMRHETDNRFADINNSQKKLSEDTNNTHNLEVSRHRVTESIYGFVSLSDLGNHFKIHIGSKTMGKLLKVVNIAKMGKSNTEPYSNLIQDGFAKSMMYGDNITYQYNPDKCIKKIDRYLEKCELLERFYLIDNEHDMQKFINDLYIENKEAV